MAASFPATITPTSMVIGAKNHQPFIIEVKIAGLNCLRPALLRLAPHYREVVVLRHYEQLKFEEIGVVLGIPVGTVKSRMSEALKQLNRFLKHLETKEETKPWNIKNQPKELLAL